MPRLFPCSCIILFSYILPLIYKGCQFLAGLLLKTPLRVSSLRALIFLSDINCPVPFAFLLEASSIHLFFQKSWNICYKGIPNKIVSLGKKWSGVGGSRDRDREKTESKEKSWHQTEMAACNHQGTGMTFPKEVNATPKGCPKHPTNPSGSRIFYYWKIIRKSRKSNCSTSKIILDNGELEMRWQTDRFTLFGKDGSVLRSGVALHTHSTLKNTKTIASYGGFR